MIQRITNYKKAKSAKMFHPRNATPESILQKRVEFMNTIFKIDRGTKDVLRNIMRVLDFRDLSSFKRVSKMCLVLVEEEIRYRKSVWQKGIPPNHSNTFWFLGEKCGGFTRTRLCRRTQTFLYIHIPCRRYRRKSVEKMKRCIDCSEHVTTKIVKRKKPRRKIKGYHV